MVIPQSIDRILRKIDKSENEWKALYMAVWHYADYIRKTYSNPSVRVMPTTSLSNPASTAVASSLNPVSSTITLGLPAAQTQSHTFQIEELLHILESRDGEFTLGHLQTLFSLFEELAREAFPILNPGVSLPDLGKWREMSSFLVSLSVLSNNDLLNLSLAKETRNCFIHRGSEIDQRWLDAYQAARGASNVALMGRNLSDGFSNLFHEIENWHNLIRRVSRGIEMKILQMP